MAITYSPSASGAGLVNNGAEGGSFRSETTSELASSLTAAGAANLSKVAAALSAANAAARLVSTNADVVLTNADVVLTHADVVLTHADVVLAEADKVQTGLDRVATAADRAAIVTLYDTFDDRYLGTKSSDPTVDNDGNSLLTGAVYFNSSLNNTKFYNGSAWENPEATATSGANTATTQANNSAGSATASANSATASGNSATAAANSASDSNTSAGQSAAQATNSANSATTSANAATAALASKLSLSGGVMTGAVTTNSTFDGRDVSVDGTKLDTVETNATADQTGSQIKTAYQAETNAFTDSQFTKLSNIETSATADQTGAQIKTAYQAETNAFTDAQFTKLSNIETSATADQTGAQIKTAYQAETNAFTDSQFTKLSNIADNANNYSHPSNHAISVVTGLQAALDAKATTTSVNNLATVYDPIGTSVAMAIALGG